MTDHDPHAAISQSDALDPARAQAMCVTLGRGDTIGMGDALPPFFHQLYFWDPRPTASLGRDGHPKVGGVIPDMGLPRRMWAGGRLSFERPLVAGRMATKTTICERAVHKEGRSGPLGFVTLRHEFTQDGVLCLTEWQDLVYREDPSPDAPRLVAPRAPTDETQTQSETFSSTTLFRYSALTFNGHRIHYDMDYAREVEGYNGLVVHGPLLAQHLMLMAEAALGPLAQFTFRATSALTLPEMATFCRRELDLWVRAPDGRLCMEAAAQPA